MKVKITTKKSQHQVKDYLQEDTTPYQHKKLILFFTFSSLPTYFNYSFLHMIFFSRKEYSHKLNQKEFISLKDIVR